MRLTIVKQGISIAEIDESRERFDAVTLSQLWVLNFNHLDAIHVALIVDVFQLDEDMITSFALGFI